MDIDVARIVKVIVAMSLLVCWLPFALCHWLWLESWVET
jgi:hypothetical protein